MDLQVVKQAAPARGGLSTWHIALLLLAAFGGAMATIVPMAYTLALRVAQLAPGSEQVLGYILGISAMLSLLYGPVLGSLSDRTRSRLGLRKPYMIGGWALGLAALMVMAFASNIPVLGVGWALTSLGWGTAVAALTNVLADRLAENQRGRVAGLSGLIAQTAPIGGIVLAGLFSADSVLVFLIPGVVAALLWLPLLLFGRDADSRDFPPAERMTLGTYVFSPRAYPDFAWNWMGSLLFFFALSLTTTFTTFFFAQRLGIVVEYVAHAVTLAAGIGLVTAVVGALGSGYLSDKIGRRRPFVLSGAALFAVGAVISAFARSLPVLLTGFTLMTLAIAVFSAANQAIVLDILPERETQAGRFTAISGMAQRVASAAAPLVAPLVVTVGATAEEMNYTLLYLVSALLGLTGGLLIFFKVSVR